MAATKKDSKLYRLEMTETVAIAVMHACEFYMRMAMGQFSELSSGLVFPHFTTDQRDAVEDHLSDVKGMLMPKLGGGHAYHSARSPALPESCRVAIDVHDVIRHRLANDRLKPGEKPGWNTSFNEPMRYADQPLVKMERIDGKA